MVASFRHRLREWRGKLTQKEAANQLGISIWTYRNWEYGVHEPTNNPTLREIEQKMGENKPQ